MTLEWKDGPWVPGSELHRSDQDGMGTSVSAAPVGLSIQLCHLHLCVETEYFGHVLLSLKDSWENEKLSLV